MKKNDDDELNELGMQLTVMREVISALIASAPDHQAFRQQLETRRRVFRATNEQHPLPDDVLDYMDSLFGSYLAQIPTR